MTLFDKLQRALGLWRWQDTAFALLPCPACNCQRLFVRLQRDEIGVRCIACGASAVTLSLIAVLRVRIPQLQQRKVYELSARGALYQWLQQQGATLTGSEYFPSVPSGEYRNGVLCQDVQALSFADNSFDLCTSTDVFEHVADDHKGFAQVARVLRPGGLFVFTVPLYGGEATIERARYVAGGNIEHLLPPEYHGDPVGPAGRILALRNYGNDIVERLCKAGFAAAEIIAPTQHWFGSGRAVVVATK